MSEGNKFEVPKSGTRDTAYILLKAGLGSIPIAGAAAAELLGLIVTPPLERRRNEWMAEIGDALKQLEDKKGVVIENLRNNDQFLDTAIEATQIAIRTNNSVKKEALKNALLNAALPNPPEETVLKMYLFFLDTFTTWHIKLLGLFDDPSRYIEKHQIPFLFKINAMSQLLEAVYPELRGREDLYDLIWRDLSSRGLVFSDISLDSKEDRQSCIVAQRTTRIGKGFIAFIQSPFEEAP